MSAKRYCVYYINLFRAELQVAWSKNFPIRYQGETDDVTTVIKKIAIFRQADRDLELSSRIHIIRIFFHWLYSPLGPWALLSVS
jgi:hypothetical protein